MNFSEYSINNRQLTFLSSLANEFNLAAGKNYLFDLAYLSSLRIAGEQAAEFLQGQVSCDVREVTASTIQRGAMCNLQGRILALFDVINWHGLQLILAKDLITATQHSLSKTAMLSRVKLEPTNAYQVFGFYLANQHDLLPTNITLPVADLSLIGTEENCCYKLSDQLYLILIKKEQALTLAQPFTLNHQIRGSLGWHQLQLRQKNIQIYPTTRGLFLPHRLDLHLTGHLSFDKGCYKGQEIVARTHYRAKLKHALELFTIATDEPFAAGKKLFAPPGTQEIGEIIDYCPMVENHNLVAASILMEHPDRVLIESQINTVVLQRITGLD